MSDRLDWGPLCPVCGKIIERLVPIMHGSVHVAWKCAPCTHELTPRMTPLPLPCPFCGGPPKVGNLLVSCLNCGACGSTVAGDVNAAVLDWNKALRP